MTHEKNVLIVGVGSIGLRHLRCFQQTDRVRLSICEIDPVLRRRVAEEHHIDRYYADLDGALADRHDAAVIATPAHFARALRHPAGGGRPAPVDRKAAQHEHGRRRRLAGNRPEPAIGRGSRLRGTRQSGSAGGERSDRVEPFRSPRASGCRVGGRVSPRTGRIPTNVLSRPRYRRRAIQDALTHAFNTVQWLVGPMDRLVADAAHQVLDGVSVEDHGSCAGPAR